MHFILDWSTRIGYWSTEPDTACGQSLVGSQVTVYLYGATWCSHICYLTPSKVMFGFTLFPFTSWIHFGYLLTCFVHCWLINIYIFFFTYVITHFTQHRPTAQLFLTLTLFMLCSSPPHSPSYFSFSSFYLFPFFLHIYLTTNLTHGIDWADFHYYFDPLYNHSI